MHKWTDTDPYVYLKTMQLHYAGRYRIRHDSIYPPQYWDIEYALSHITESWLTRLSMEITALYYHTFADSEFSVSAPPTIYESHHTTSDGWGTLKRVIGDVLYHIERVFADWCVRHGARVNEDGRPIGNHVKIPERIKKALRLESSYRMETKYTGGFDHTVEHVEDALVAQMWLLRRNSLEPRAVLCSSELYGLISAAAGQDTRYYNVAVANNNWTFMGIPIILCGELKRGAVVV